MNKDLDYYLNLDWTLIEGTDLDFNGNPYHYIEIKEIPSFAFCASSDANFTASLGRIFIFQFPAIYNFLILFLQ